MTTFNEFWSLFPRKVDKRKAQKSWDREIKSGVNPLVILNGLRRQLPMLLRKDPQFIPHPTTWLNGGRWEDEDIAPPARPSLEYRQNARAAIADINSQLFAEEPSYERQIDLLAYSPAGSRH